MPKATISFTLPEEHEEFHEAVHASNYRMALWDISQDVFRPHRKHGYSDTKLNDLLEFHTEDPEGHGDKVCEAISLLEQKFYEILSERTIEL